MMRLAGEEREYANESKGTHFQAQFRPSLQFDYSPTTAALFLLPRFYVFTQVTIAFLGALFLLARFLLLFATIFDGAYTLTINKFKGRNYHSPFLVLHKYCTSGFSLPYSYSTSLSFLPYILLLRSSWHSYSERKSLLHSAFSSSSTQQLPSSP